MNIEYRKALHLLLMVALSLVQGWAQTSTKDAKSQQIALATNPTTATVPTAGMNSKDMEQFVIGSDDVLAVDVWKEPEVSHVVSVRSDGKISLALIGEIQAAGKTPKQLEADITNGLRSYISDPEVTVIIQAMNSKKYNILGRVGRSGSFPLTGPTTVLDAIAVSGGFHDFAKRKKIYVLRTAADGREVRIPFNYTEVIRGKHPEQNIQLQSHDTIVVP